MFKAAYKADPGFDSSWHEFCIIPDCKDRIFQGTEKSPVALIAPGNLYSGR